MWYVVYYYYYYYNSEQNGSKVQMPVQYGSETSVGIPFSI